MTAAMQNQENNFSTTAQCANLGGTDTGSELSLPLGDKDHLRALPLELRERIYLYCGFPVGSEWYHACESLVVSTYSLHSYVHLHHATVVS